MNSSVLNPATHETSLFLLRNEDNSEIMTPSLLLPFNQDNSAIMTATNASLLLPFNQDNPVIMTATYAQNLLKIFCCSASKTIQPIPSFIRLLDSFEELRLPKPLLIIFQFRREHIKSLQPLFDLSSLMLNQSRREHDLLQLLFFELQSATSSWL